MTEAQMLPEIAQNCATEGQLGAILAQLSYDQIRFLIARAEAESDAQACRDIRMSRSTVSHWPEETRELIKAALVAMAQDGVVTALHIRKRSLAKAMATKRDGLDSNDERLRQSVATEIIEWELGKAKQPQEHTGAGGGPIETKDVTLGAEERNRALATLAEHIAGGLYPDGDE